MSAREIQNVGDIMGLRVSCQRVCCHLRCAISAERLVDKSIEPAKLEVKNWQSLLMRDTGARQDTDC